MKYKEFTNNSYGLEAKEVPPKPKTYSDIKEDVKIYDPTGKKHSEAKRYIDTYKGSFRPVPKIVDKQTHLINKTHYEFISWN